MLKKGQVVYIRGEKNVVINMIEFKEDTWVWQEYEIVNDVTKKHTWLSVEQDEQGNTEYYVYENYNGAVNENEMEFTSNNKKYKLYETGTATVKNFFGNADVDLFERCQFKDFICEEDNTIISVEKWTGEKEVTIGYKMDTKDVNISEEVDVNVARTAGGSGGKSMASTVVFIVSVVAVVLISAIISIIPPNKSIEKYLKKQTSKYEYVTSVTNNEDNSKAQVYLSEYTTIDQTVKDIIDGVPEGITKTKDEDSSTEEDGIGLETSNEYAYIYKENEKVYVQVSSKKYVENSGTTYHSGHRIHYYNTYRTSNENSTYKSYANSARQSSINSRTSSGGGTSSGK